ncbi:MAG: CBS domain-containing protein [Bacteroidota bacterium]
MRVRDLMTESPATCNPGSRLEHVAKMMLDCDCGAIPVTDEGNKPVGIVTDRDIVIRTLARGEDALNKTAKDVMTRSTITVHEDDDLDLCASVMEENQIRRVIVVNDTNEIVGIVAQADIARHASEELTGEVVEEISE